MILEIVFWHWLAFGALLLIVELLAPGMFFLWMAESALVTGLVLWVFPTMAFEYQVAFFSVLSVISIMAARSFLKSHPIISDKPQLNQRTALFIGRSFVLDQAMENGEGRVRIGDTIWKVRGKNCQAGQRVKVVGTDGVVLLVDEAGEGS